MPSYHTNDKLAETIARTAFPTYKGRTIQVSPFDGEFPFHSAYWSGGTRSYYSIVNLTSMKMVNLPTQNPLRDPGIPKAHIPEDCAVVEHVIFCGKDMGIRIHVREENFAKLLPEGEELSRHEKIVLSATRSYKNTYAGETNCRFREARRITGISEKDYETAKNSLFAKGLLAKHGKSYRITNEGRNAIQMEQLWNLREEA